ncbi:DUF427 domain-containing protein [Meiothermus sp.]|uniref:DUF427 domain-containing protein n=1 Tax=Meiothermus sp. TaxID=1955249 RepID=UPI00307E4888
MESVWDYPRPPRCEPTAKRVQVKLGELVIADTTLAYRVLETSHPPVYYIPPADIRMDLLEATPRRTYCEFKGQASYWTLKAGDTVLPNVAWSYEDPTPGFAAIKGYLAFYLEPLEGFVDGEKAQPQPGRFYGGWITQDLVGPFKGGPESQGW